MKNNATLSIITAAGILCLTANAYVQSGTGSGQSGTGQTGQSGTGQSGTGQSGTGQTGTTKSAGDMADLHMSKNKICVHPGTEIIGAKVVNPAGENLGKVEDIVIRPSGEVAYSVLSFGGTMGVGDKLFAIPFDLLQCKDMKDMSDKGRDTTGAGSTTGSTSSSSSGMATGMRDNTLVLNVDKERLKNAPGFDKKNWPSTVDATDWTREVDSYYASDRRMTANRPVEASARISPFLIKLSDLKGANVETPTGEKLGDIKEVGIDTNGHVNFAAVSVGGFLGMGDRLVAVPWDALKVTRDPTKKSEKEKITLATTKERLEQAPQFKEGRDKWNEMTDPTFMNRVYEFYSVRPYWSQSDMDKSRTDTDRRDQEDKNRRDKDDKNPK